MLQKEEYEKLFIIGNGFDLSCGLKTSYKNFYESSFFDSLGKGPKDSKKSINIYDHLKSKQVMNNWLDLEQELKQIVKQIKNTHYVFCQI